MVMAFRACAYRHTRVHVPKVNFKHILSLERNLPQVYATVEATGGVLTCNPDSHALAEVWFPLSALESCKQQVIRAVLNVRQDVYHLQVMDARSDAAEAATAIENTTKSDKDARKAAKKQLKAERRAKREGTLDPGVGRKPCGMCGTPSDLLIRCQYDESQEWHMVCGKCWKIASGGVVDGDADHPHYRYGGLWKNRKAQK